MLKILLAVDDSGASEKAVAFVGEILGQRVGGGFSVTLLHVIESLPEFVLTRAARPETGTAFRTRPDGRIVGWLAFEALGSSALVLCAKAQRPKRNDQSATKPGDAPFRNRPPPTRRHAPPFHRPAKHAILKAGAS